MKSKARKNSWCATTLVLHLFLGICCVQSQEVQPENFVGNIFPDKAQLVESSDAESRQEAFPWLCEKVEVSNSGDLELHAVVPRDSYKPHSVLVSVGEGAKIPVYQEFRYYQARETNVGRYFASKDRYSLSYVDGSPIDLSAFTAQVKEGTPVFFVFERSNVSKQFRASVKPDVLLVTIKIDDRTYFWKGEK